MNTKKVLTLLGASALVAFLAVLSLTSVSVIQGQGTDVELPSQSFLPQQPAAAPEGTAPPSLPPATNLPPAPIEQPTAPEAAQVPTSAEAPAVAQLPAAGSGGMLDESGGVLAWLIFMGIGGAFLVSIGGLASLRNHKS